MNNSNKIKEVVNIEKLNITSEINDPNDENDNDEEEEDTQPELYIEDSDINEEVNQEIIKR